VPFIVLLFALYVISGGVRIEGDLVATPRVNTTFLGVGALAASFIGTTGAAMLLVRPLLETNKERRHVAHTLVFFIFLVCNTGGCLLPIGDPPLFMGYLRGVPFGWTLSLWKEWLVVNGLLLIAYAAIDTVLHRKERGEVQRADEHKRFRVEGAVNIPLLALAIAAVAVVVPGSPIPGLGVTAPVFAREGLLGRPQGVGVPFGAVMILHRHECRFATLGQAHVVALQIGLDPFAQLQQRRPLCLRVGLGDPRRFPDSGDLHLVRELDFALVDAAGDRCRGLWVR
jgi:hypothetical protein